MPLFQYLPDRQTVLNRFGTDPGPLSASTYIPKNFPKNSPLVVVLHGSTQSVESYNIGSGWSALADEWRNTDPCWRRMTISKDDHARESTLTSRTYVYYAWAVRVLRLYLENLGMRNF